MRAPDDRPLAVRYCNDPACDCGMAGENSLRVQDDGKAISFAWPGGYPVVHVMNDIDEAVLFLRGLTGDNVNGLGYTSVANARAFLARLDKAGAR